MAGVQDTEVIDVVAHDPVAGEYLLAMVEERPWGSDPEQELQLRAKINTYAGFVLDGNLQRQYPETEGKRVRLQLDCTAQPTDDVVRIVEHANTKLSEYGLRLVLNVRA